MSSLTTSKASRKARRNSNTPAPLTKEVAAAGQRAGNTRLKGSIKASAKPRSKQAVSAKARRGEAVSEDSESEGISGSEDEGQEDNESRDGRGYDTNAKNRTTVTNAKANNQSSLVQQLRDEMEELTDEKERLDSKVTQLEERAQYLEASARLNASKLAAEIMELKEKARKLEIELSTVGDERDALEQEAEDLKEQMMGTEVMDEARQMSTQLKAAWLRISTMKSSQDEHVQRLYKAEEANAKLKSEVAKVLELSNTTRNSHADEKKLWEREKQDYLSEIDSLKEKLSLSGKDGGKQILDWEQDKTRLRNGLQQERAVWDKEKRGFLDQIASLKVKATALSVQKTAPPDWILEKHKLMEQCATLQSRVATLESDRVNAVSLTHPSVEKLKADKQKQAKKVEALKVKLAEVMEHLMAMQAKADEKKSKQDSSTKKAASSSRQRSSTTRSRGKAAGRYSDSEGEDIDMTEEGREQTTKLPSPPALRTRTKRSAAAKSVIYKFESSDDSEEADQGDDDDNDDKEVAGDSVVEDDSSYDNSDDDFEPEKIVAASKSRSRTVTKKADSPTVEPVSKKVKGAASSKRRADETETSAAPSSTSELASGPQVATLPAVPVIVETVSSTPAVALATPTSSTGTSTPATAIEGDQPKAVEKVKKKRKLLTGKGLDELGDILNGPGSSLSSTPSAGLVFSNGKMRSKNIGASLLSDTGPKPAKLEALHAIKMAFALPKPRNSSPARDMDT